MNKEDRNNCSNKREIKFTFSYHTPQSNKTLTELANELVEDTIRKAISKCRNKNYNYDGNHLQG